MKLFLPLILAASFVPGAAIAQVSVNPAALTQLAGLPASPPAPPHETAPKVNHAAFVRHWHHVAAKVKKPLPLPLPPTVEPAVARPAPALPDLPMTPPAAPNLSAPVAPKAPVTVPAVAKPAIAAPVAPKPAAPKPPAGPAPVNIIFATDSAILPADAEARLAPFCKVSGPIVINARAPADPEDDSHSMRLSLARALAIRASLSACGVASQNIFPRALGAAPGGATDTTEIQAGLNP